MRRTGRLSRLQVRPGRLSTIQVSRLGMSSKIHVRGPGVVKDTGEEAREIVKDIG